jgi:hypothetical protein
LLAPLAPDVPHLRVCLYPGRACAGAADDRARVLEIQEIRRLEVRAGTRWRAGALIGGVLGIAAGGLAHGLASDTDSNFGPVRPAAWFLLTGALGGALWGAVFGAGFDAWRAAP